MASMLTQDDTQVHDTQMHGGPRAAQLRASRAVLTVLCCAGSSSGSHGHMRHVHEPSGMAWLTVNRSWFTNIRPYAIEELLMLARLQHNVAHARALASVNMHRDQCCEGRTCFPQHVQGGFS